MNLEPLIQSEGRQKETQQYSTLTYIYIYIYIYIYMEFRKMSMMTLYAREQKRLRCIEESFGLRGRRRGKDDWREEH